MKQLCCSKKGNGWGCCYKIREDGMGCVAFSLIIKVKLFFFPTFFPSSSFSSFCRLFTLLIFKLLSVVSKLDSFFSSVLLFLEELKTFCFLFRKPFLLNSDKMCEENVSTKTKNFSFFFVFIHFFILLPHLMFSLSHKRLMLFNNNHKRRCFVRSSRKGRQLKTWYL